MSVSSGWTFTINFIRKDLEKKYKKLLKLEPEVRKDILENEDVSFKEDMGHFIVF